MKTLVVHCHPNPDSLSAALYRTAVESLTHAGHELRATDLYAEGFNPTLSREEREAYLVNPQLIEARVQPHVDALRWAEHLVFVYPTWFYGPPSMLKGWLEPFDYAPRTRVIFGPGTIQQLWFSSCRRT